MKQYKVLKNLIGSNIGDILVLHNDSYNNLYLDDRCIIGSTLFDLAIDQGFIEPYTPKPKHWRANNGCSYYTVDEFGDVCRRVDYYETCSNALYNSGNYYKSQVTSELVAKSKKLFLEWLHDKEAGYCIDMINNFTNAMDEAKQAVLEDDSNE